MSLPYETTSNLPLGFTSAVTIPGMGSSIVESVSGNAFSSRIISRTTGEGDLADFEIREASEPTEITLTVQRAASDTAIPTAGGAFTYDFNKSGTATDLIVKDATVNIDKDSFDTVDVVCVIKPAAATS